MTVSIRTYIVGALLIGLAVTATVQTVRLAQAETARAKVAGEFDAYRADAEKTARNASETYRREEARRNEAMRKADAEAQSNVAAARADAAAARDSLVRLRARAAAVPRGGATSGHSPAAGIGPPAEAAAYLSTDDVLQGLGDAAGQLAEFADESFIAGTTCERAYDALTQGASLQ